MQLGSDVHRLGDRERERLLLEEVAILVQHPVGDGAFPLLSRTLRDGRHGREGQQQRCDAAEFPPAAATRIERFHRFSFRRFQPAAGPDRARSESGKKPPPPPVTGGLPVPDPTSHWSNARSGTRDQRSRPFVCSAATLARWGLGAPASGRHRGHRPRNRTPLTRLHGRGGWDRRSSDRHAGRRPAKRAGMLRPGGTPPRSAGLRPASRPQAAKPHPLTRLRGRNGLERRLQPARGPQARRARRAHRTDGAHGRYRPGPTP